MDDHRPEFPALGPGVYASALVAHHLGARLKDALVRAQREGARWPAEVVAYIDAMDRLGRAYRTSRTPDPTSSPISDTGTIGTISSGTSPIIAPMSVSDVAARLGTTDRWVRVLAAREALPAHRVGRRWVFDRADVDEYLEEKAR